MAVQMPSWLNQLKKPALDPFFILYGEKIPVDVQCHITNWILEQLNNAPVYYGEQKKLINDMYEDAVNFLNKFIAKLRCTGALYPNEIKTELDGSACILLELFLSNPVALYQELINCLQRQPYHCIVLDAIEETKVSRELELVKLMVLQNENDNGNLIMKHGYLAQEISKLQNIKAMLNTDQRAEERMYTQYQLIQHQKLVRCHLQTFSEMHFALVREFRKAIHKTDKLQDKILNKYLAQWKVNQRLAAIGASATVERDLNTIQSWCESLVEVILRIKEQIMQTINIKSEGYADLMTDPVLTQAMRDVTNLLETLIYNSFIVEHQPPQVLRLRGYFPTNVRLLTGTKLHNLLKPLHVSVSIISEAQAREVHLSNEATTSAAGQMSNNLTVMQYNEPANRFSAMFSKLRIDSIRRTVVNKQNNKCVLDEKFVLLFQATVATKRNDLILPIRAVSCPVVCIVHISQEEKSYATIVWENVFAKNIHTPFNVPELVLWNWLAEVLNMNFSCVGNHRLSAEHLHFLCKKALRSVEIPFPTPNDLTISWYQFCKDELPGRGYTFWGWFYQAKKLTRSHLQDLWCDGRIHGFITKSAAEQYLTNSLPGTFLMRFTDSILGGISIAFVQADNVDQRQIFHIEPFTAKDLSIRSLADRILDIDVLTHLYPDVPKHEVFQRQAAQSSKPSPQTNYIATELRTTLIFPPVDQSSNETPINDQEPVMSEYTYANNNGVLYLDLATMSILTEMS